MLTKVGADQRNAGAIRTKRGVDARNPEAQVERRLSQMQRRRRLPRKLVRRVNQSTQPKQKIASTHSKATLTKQKLISLGKPFADAMEEQSAQASWYASFLIRFTHSIGRRPLKRFQRILQTRKQLTATRRDPLISVQSVATIFRCGRPERLFRLSGYGVRPAHKVQ